MDKTKLYFTNKPNRLMEGQSRCPRCYYAKHFGTGAIGWSCSMYTFVATGRHYCSECKEFIENKIKEKFGGNINGN